ncbi:MAG: hypothetical protein HOW73_28790, partial [Polyangiaceae bacterium]|nr:hypothetical protein [Polyangiaceae bacterium]
MTSMRLYVWSCLIGGALIASGCGDDTTDGGGGSGGGAGGDNQGGTPGAGGSVGD